MRWILAALAAVLLALLTASGALGADGFAPSWQLRASQSGSDGDSWTSTDPNVAYNSQDDEYLVVWTGTVGANLKARWSAAGSSDVVVEGTLKARDLSAAGGPLSRTDDKISGLRIFEDAAGKTLAQDDDGGGMRNARISFLAPSAGPYRIVVTTYRDREVGEFRLTVAH